MPVSVWLGPGRVCTLPAELCLRVWTSAAWLAEHPLYLTDFVHRAHLHVPCPDSLLPEGLWRGVRIPCAKRAWGGRWVRVLCLWLQGLPPRLRGPGGGGPLLAAARAHAGHGTRRVRARARAPRLQPSARIRLRSHSQLPGAAATYPRPGALSTGPTPLCGSQEASSRMPGPVSTAAASAASGRAPSAGGRRYRGRPLPAGGSALRPRVAAPDPHPGQPLPQPTPEGGREEGREQEGASERGSRSKARAATGSLGNGCHSNGVALPGNAAAGRRRLLPPLPHSTRGFSPWVQGERGCGDSSSCRGGSVTPLAHLSVPASTARRWWGWGARTRWARSGSHVATVVAAGLLGWLKTWGYPGLGQQEVAWRQGLGSVPCHPHRQYTTGLPNGPIRVGCPQR